MNVRKSYVAICKTKQPFRSALSFFSEKEEEEENSLPAEKRMLFRVVDLAMPSEKLSQMSPGSPSDMLEQKKPPCPALNALTGCLL